MRRVATFLVVLCVLLAGCGGSTTPSSTASATNTPTPTASPTAMSTPTSTPTLTATTAPEPSYDNPWNVETIGVYVVPSDRNYMPQIRKALSWWEQNADAKSRYSQVDFRLTGNRPDAELVIVFVDQIVCEGEVADDIVGCAPTPGVDERFDAPARIKIKTGYTNSSTVSILKHEIGHTLSLGHSNRLPFMTAKNELAELPQVDAVNKTNPWEQSEITVYVDKSAVPKPLESDVETQMDHVFTYFNNGGEGATPPNATLVRTYSVENADIVITLVRNSEIENNEYVTGTWYGDDPDEDDKLETVTSGEIRVAYDVSTEKGIIGYNTGFYVAAMLEASGEDLPPPWRDDSITYKDEWWERA